MAVYLKYNLKKIQLCMVVTALTTNSAAQAGNATSITLAATDVQPTGAYNGMMLYIVSGLGAGQYGVITSFNASTKIATIEKERWYKRL